jgi:2-haloacid dehalogenase
MVIVFDVNGTLLDTRSLAPQIRSLFGRHYSAEEWFKEVVQYSMATSLAGDYREFGEIALAVLQMAAVARGVALTNTAMEKIKTGLEHLPPYPEVQKSLHRLGKAGFRLAVLSNSSAPSLDKQLQNSGIGQYIEHAVSVDAVRRYKPAAETYRAAADRLGVETRDMLMVAAHPWDLLGASRAGCRTAFLARPGKALLPGAPAPEYMATDLRALVDQLISRKDAERSYQMTAGG